MKTVLLLAGKGRRLENFTHQKHKAMLKIQGKSILNHLVERLSFWGLREFVPVVGYHGQEIIDYLRKTFSRDLIFEPVFNENYQETNNLFSLWCAREKISDSDFIVCNGDLVLNKYIIKNLLKGKNLSTIAIDDSPRLSPIDSPGIIVRGGRILDLGRYVSFKKSAGYAIGLYRFNKSLSKVFFPEAEKVIGDNKNAGFHEPLTALFKKHPVFKRSTNGMYWIDVDTKEDLFFAKKLFTEIIKQEKR